MEIKFHYLSLKCLSLSVMDVRSAVSELQHSQGI